MSSDPITSVSQAPTSIAPTMNDNTTGSEKRTPIEQNITEQEISSDPLPKTRLEVFLLISALSLANLLVALDTTIVTTALPVISQNFHSSAGYAWIGSGYVLATAVTTPVWAKLSDIWGRKPLLLIAISLFFIGSLVCGLAVNMLNLIFGRVVQGVGGGGLNILVTICISDSFSMRDRPLYFGIIGMTWAFASATGPLLGGVLTEKATWRWCFFINLPCTAVCFFIVLWKLKVHTPKTGIWEGLKAIDWLGSVIMITGTVLFLLALQMGGSEYSWSSPIVVSFLIIGVALIVVFVLVEWKVAKYPLTPLRTFNQRSNVAAIGVSAFHSMVITGGSYFLPLYFQGVHGATPLKSGIYLIPLALSLSITNVIVGIMVRKTGKFLLAMRVSTLVMALGFGLLIDLPADYNWTKLIIYQLIAGIGIGPNFQCPMIALQATTPQNDQAAATATMNFLRNLSTSIIIVISSSIFQNSMEKQQGRLSTQLGPDMAKLLNGANAAANVEAISNLPISQRTIAQLAFLKGMFGLWILYVVLAAGAFLCSLFCLSAILSKDHTMTETGLGAEEEKRRKRVLQGEKV